MYSNSVQYTIPTQTTLFNVLHLYKFHNIVFSNYKYMYSTYLLNIMKFGIKKQTCTQIDIHCTHAYTGIKWQQLYMYTIYIHNSWNHGIVCMIYLHVIFTMVHYAGGNGYRLLQSNIHTCTLYNRSLETSIESHTNHQRAVKDPWRLNR